jgi:membrane-associated protein
VFNSLVDATSGPWFYALIFAIAYLDSFFPVVPSETMVIAGGVLAGSGKLELPYVLLAAATGAILGDNFAYLLGRQFGERVANRLFRGERARRTLKWVETQLDDRGGMLIVVARFIPGGRTATTVTCGIVGFPWPSRFVPFTVLGGVGWALYAGIIGYVGGKSFEQQPWKGLVVALVIAGSVAVAIELVRHFRRRRDAPA